MHIGASLKVSGMLAFFWASASLATPAGTASSEPPSTLPGATGAKVPSIRISGEQTGLAGTCGGSAFDVNTFIDVGSQASADVRLSAPGVGLIQEFTDETGKNIGPYAAAFPSFHIPAFGGGLAPNTPIKLTITTYSGPGLTGSVTFVSTLVFDCTTGVILQAPPIGAALPIPALSPALTAALVALLALLGAMRLRRPSRRRRV